MNTTPLKNYAPQARKDFIAAVTTQAARLGITPKETAPATVEGDVLLVQGQAFPKTVQGGRDNLIKQVKADGFNQVMDRIAYTWFNRFVAIRYMELHNYLGHGYRVLSDPQGTGRPEILDHAADVDLPGLDRAKVVELKLDGTKDEELYRLLLKAQCNALNKAMPFLFEPIGHETELLLPANLLQTDSLIRKLVESIEEDAWEQIEIIGWLYQFYISEKKDQVIGKVVKSEDIPAATQLFTPNWIVKYMVQNSLGAQWLATYPHSSLRGMMEYYIEPAEQTKEVKEQLAAITPEALDPEELTLIDPACGSGHILVEAYDLFKAIYLERGYRERDAAKVILTKNLYGLDIDQRAAQLSGFALMMKGRADDRRLFERDIKLNVMAMVNSDELDIGFLTHAIKSNKMGLEESDLRELKKLFEHATTFGSLIQIPEHLASKLPAMRQLCDPEEGYLYVEKALENLEPLIRQAEILAGCYDYVVANPPYMGTKYQHGELKDFVTTTYGDASGDLYTCFLEQSRAFCNSYGLFSLVTRQNWMFASSFEDFRNQWLRRICIHSLVHLGSGAFDSISGEVVKVAAAVYSRHQLHDFRPVFIEASEGDEEKKRGRVKSPSARYISLCLVDFLNFPGCSVAYWASTALITAFHKFVKLDELLAIKSGMSTGNNELFQRYWSEVSIETTSLKKSIDDATWVPCNSGGSFRRWYGNNERIVLWKNQGSLMKQYRNKSGKIASAIRNEEYYFQPGLTWTKNSAGRFAVRWMAEGFAFDDTGRSGFVKNGDFARQKLMAVLNSAFVEKALEILAPDMSVTSKQLARVPIPTIKEDVTSLVDEAVTIAKTDWDAFEESFDFALPEILRYETKTTSEAWKVHLQTSTEKVGKLAKIEQRINAIVSQAAEMSHNLELESLANISLKCNHRFRYDKKDSQMQLIAFREDTMQELVSYAIGCMMGRYSLDEPGLIYAHSRNEGFDPGRYRKFPADEDGIIPLLDTAWFEDDAANRLVEFISVAWDGENLEENLTFLANNLSPNKKESGRDTIRRYLCDKFFKDHLQTYKNRPIYWLFSSGKQKAFQCLVYLHRYNEGTLARMRSEYVIPLQGKIAARLEHLKVDLATASSSAQTKRLTKEADKLKKQQAELLKFDEKLRHYADRRISLDLDDGVKVNYGKFGSLLAEAKKVHGQKPEGP